MRTTPCRLMLVNSVAVKNSPAARVRFRESKCNTRDLLQLDQRKRVAILLVRMNAYEILRARPPNRHGVEQLFDAGGLGE